MLQTQGSVLDHPVFLFGLPKASSLVCWGLLSVLQLGLWPPMPWEESFCPGVSLAFAGWLPCTLESPGLSGGGDRLHCCCEAAALHLAKVPCVLGDIPELSFFGSSLLGCSYALSTEAREGGGGGYRLVPSLHHLEF